MSTLTHKLGLIEAKRKEQQHTVSRDAAYEEIFSPVNDAFENETSLAPLEVSDPSPQSTNNPRDESFSSDGGGDDNYSTSVNRRNFFNTDPCNHLSKKNDFIYSPKQISWILYLCGMVGMSFLNPLCCVLAMKYANPSVLAPFSGLTLVWVVLFSGIALGELPGRSQQLACALIVLGEILVAFFGDHTNGEDRGVEDVVSIYY